MERIFTLIDKLYQQKQQGAAPAQLLFTVQLLQQELSLLQNEGISSSKNKVAVTMPRNFSVSLETPGLVQLNEAIAKELVASKTYSAQEQTGATEKPVAAQPDDGSKPYTMYMPVPSEENKKPAYTEQPPPVYNGQGIYNSALDTFIEAPTLAQYADRREVQHNIPYQKESLNDRLKQDNKEVAHRLKDAPIKDLRKAIGINDRFLFVNHLFRGDEAMYERSIKTINGFNIYSEAEYWISRELRLKLMWLDDNEMVQHFSELVRRRFS